MHLSLSPSSLLFVDIYNVCYKRSMVVKKSGFIILCLFILVSTSSAQSKDINLSVSPGVEIPFGENGDKGYDYMEQSEI